MSLETEKTDIKQIILNLEYKFEDTNTYFKFHNW